MFRFWLTGWNKTRRAQQRAQPHSSPSRDVHPRFSDRPGPSSLRLSPVSPQQGVQPRRHAVAGVNWRRSQSQGRLPFPPAGGLVPGSRGGSAGATIPLAEAAPLRQSPTVLARCAPLASGPSTTPPAQHPQPATAAPPPCWVLLLPCPGPVRRRRGSRQLDPRPDLCLASFQRAQQEGGSIPLFGRIEDPGG